MFASSARLQQLQTTPGESAALTHSPPKDTVAGSTPKRRKGRDSADGPTPEKALPEVPAFPTLSNPKGNVKSATVCGLCQVAVQVPDPRVRCVRDRLWMYYTPEGERLGSGCRLCSDSVDDLVAQGEPTSLDALVVDLHVPEQSELRYKFFNAVAANIERHNAGAQVEHVYRVKKTLTRTATMSFSKWRRIKSVCPRCLQRTGSRTGWRL